MPFRDFWTRHADACRRQASTYVDPATGYQVFTAYGLRQRGRCCGSGCRHCPFAHEAVPLAQRAARIHQASWLTPAPEGTGPYTVLFWSGGKDSFLTYRALCREQGPDAVVALTTFDSGTRRVAHQEVAMDTVVSQAEQLGLPLVGVPLRPGAPYLDQVSGGLDLVQPIGALAFGDLHLAHIRAWREREFGPLVSERGAVLRFPLWHADYPRLLDDLEASAAECRISAVVHPALSFVAIGERFDRAFVARLPPHVDAFGEQGEFHTVVQPAP